MRQALDYREDHAPGQQCPLTLIWGLSFWNLFWFPFLFARWCWDLLYTPAHCRKLKITIELDTSYYYLLVHLIRFELITFGFEDRHSIQLSYRCPWRSHRESNSALRDENPLSSPIDDGSIYLIITLFEYLSMNDLITDTFLEIHQKTFLYVFDPFYCYVL